MACERLGPIRVAIYWRLKKTVLNENQGCVFILLPHLLPTRTGQAACNVRRSTAPDRYKLNQKAAVPFLGQIVTFNLGKTVAPPCSTSLIYRKEINP